MNTATIRMLATEEEEAEEKANYRVSFF